MKKILLIGFLVVIAGCANMDKVVIKAEKDLVVNVEIADTLGKRAAGLMNRSSMPANDGMLFIFPFQSSKSFWMKHTLIPLDLLFITKELEIVDIKENFQPCTTLLCETYRSKSAKYVLEVNGGYVNKNNIKIGDKIELDLKS